MTVTEKIRPSSRESFWATFFPTFLTIFAAEMGDKTQISTLLITAQSQSPLTVFAASALALIATSLIGVVIGRYLVGRLSPLVLDVAVAMLLMLISIQLISEVIQP